MSQKDEVKPTAVEHLPNGTVLIAGGGPVGLILARVLSFYGVKSVLFERNKTTTKWPKMDLTNARSMELFRKLGLADALRQQGVSPEFDMDVLISTGLAQENPLAKWHLPGVDKSRKIIREKNDGTQPLEPYQRLSQAIFEKWLKAICEEDPLIDLRYGNTVESVQEEGGRVKTIVTNVDTSISTAFISDYVAGCDGASSRTRRSIEAPLDGGPIPAFALLIHFKSRDLTRLHKQGRFWHIFFAGEASGLKGAIISQDEVDTWTTHLFLPLDADPEQFDSRQVIYSVLGGLYGEYPIEVDEILVRSSWRPYIAVTRTWSGLDYRVHLAGDAVHQNIPTGGYGMNMGIADAYDLGWKLASVIHGQGGKELLKSYELERKPVALRNVERSGVHFQVHEDMKEILSGGDPRRVDHETEEGRNLRAKVQNHYEVHDGENKDSGIELGYRYQSPVIIPDKDSTEPTWKPSEYTPTTWPGGRPPHVFLSDGSAIYDAFGKDWTIAVFSDEENGQKHIVKAAQDLGIPLKQVDLSKEELAKRLYEKNIVLLRPDQHVAFRADRVSGAEEAEKVLKTVTGQGIRSDGAEDGIKPGQKTEGTFTATAGSTTQVSEFELERMGDFQR